MIMLSFVFVIFLPHIVNAASLQVTSPAPSTTTSDNTPTFTGAGIYRGTVTLAEGGKLICTAMVTPDETWNCTPTIPLAEGWHNFMFSGTDAEGNPTPTLSYSFTIDTSPAPPTVITSPLSGSSTPDTTPTITGTGESGATVTVTEEFGNVLCKTTIDGAGNWNCDSIKQLGEGPQTIFATQVDIAGNSSSSSLMVLEIATDTDRSPPANENNIHTMGDANNDRKPDSRQGGVTSIPNPVTEGYGNSALAVYGGNCPNVNYFEIKTEDQLPKQDTRFEYPVGLRDFELDCFVAGGTVNVTIYLDKIYDTSRWAYRTFNNASQTYHDISSTVTYGTLIVGGRPKVTSEGATIIGARRTTTINFNATDGGPLDEDGVANGIFRNSSGPAISTFVQRLSSFASSSKAFTPEVTGTIFTPTDAVPLNEDVHTPNDPVVRIVSPASPHEILIPVILSGLTLLTGGLAIAITRLVRSRWMK